MTAAACRLCRAELSRTFVDLGLMPLANAYLDPNQPTTDEPRYPLHVMVCDSCLLIQIEEMVSPSELFTDYAYFSSYSDSWIEHSRRFAELAVRNLVLGRNSLVVEVASNDGYLLQHFVAAGVPVLGIEPAANVAQVAISRGIPTETTFFGRETALDLAGRRCLADLLVANNVLAHVPDLDDFVAGLALAVKPTGVLSVEVPHLLNLLEHGLFDTIYHEHFSYFSLLTAEIAFSKHGLQVFDVELLPTHGGSLRIWAAPKDAGRGVSQRVFDTRQLEEDRGLHRLETYTGFQRCVDHCRTTVRGFFAKARAEGKTVAAYGAAAKGNTLLSFCGIGEQDIAYVADRNPGKRGRLLPGSHLPIEPPERIFDTRPDYVVILPWNLRDEIRSQLAGIADWGGRFVTLVPDVKVFP